MESLSRMITCYLPECPRPIGRHIHFIGFKDDRWWNAVKTFGFPDFIHPGWDIRAAREIAKGDTVVFAAGDWRQEPRVQSFTDLIERE